jgi:hypothetical protein
VNLVLALVQEATPSPGISTVFTPPPPSGGDVFVAVLTIVLALAAAVVGYRIIRGGRGL